MSCCSLKLRRSPVETYLVWGGVGEACAWKGFRNSVAYVRQPHKRFTQFPTQRHKVPSVYDEVLSHHSPHSFHGPGRSKGPAGATHSLVLYTRVGPCAPPVDLVWEVWKGVHDQWKDPVQNMRERVGRRRLWEEESGCPSVFPTTVGIPPHTHTSPRLLGKVRPLWSPPSRLPGPTSLGRSPLVMWRLNLAMGE